MLVNRIELTNFLTVSLSPQFTGVFRFSVFKVLLSHWNLIDRVIPGRLLLLLFGLLPVLVDDAVEGHGVVIVDVGAEWGSGGRRLDVVAVAVVRALIVAHGGRGIHQVRAVAVREVVLLEEKIKEYFSNDFASFILFLLF